MVSIQDLSVSFGSFDLLTDISFLINDRDRIGLAGRNGSGKSTLLRIIAGLQSPSSGKVDRSDEITIGYLPQQMKVDDSTTIMNEVISAFSELTGLAGEIEKCTREIAEREDYDSPGYLNLCDHLTIIEERYRILGGSNYLAEAEKTLTGLGFDRKEFDRPTRELSGGWRMRVELAKILLKKPSLFLLDEPTNHLDIESIQWLETFLSDYSGAVVLVSHDRAFLDAVTTRTIEISLGKIYDYRVPWSEFVVLRKERREQQIAAYRNQQKMIEDTERFIERFRYKATKAVQVQSKIKQLNKIERLEVDEEDTSQINLRFPPAPRSGTTVAEATGLSVSFGSKSVLDKVDFKIHRGDKVAFVGRNGEGKTTFSRIIIGELDHQGVLKKGHNVRTGYFAQNQDELLNENLTVFETIDQVAKGEIRAKIRDMLGAFLFRGDDIDKKVRVLSGGERSRLALVKLLLEPYNLLVLDEPTNHLDMRSKDILKQALLNYDGTLIIVSHDRDFLNGIAERVYEFRNHKIKEHIGGIYDFLRKKKIENLKELERRDIRKASVEDTVSLNKQKYLEKKEYERNLRKLRRRLEESENEIVRIEAEMSEIDRALNSGDHSSTGANDYFSRYQKLKEEHNNEMEKWTQYNHDIEVFLENNNL
ncbi:MAG TPA: ABC-F family ATP-binding cassette domain-containing protein [Bacteroidales bacterium]|nr:ABC-F family ATP-binding cassette domain-containing protein [Bacteroidales bacterium]HPJ60640.1 ABC-F family ATP-binding cassette domain-containing protein [Bacteroidales bacterium]HPR13557.1 ABC-F family ATP-binding cassette domain-containing protein [Bacteroidales bacterium]